MQRTRPDHRKVGQCHAVLDLVFEFTEEVQIGRVALEDDWSAFFLAVVDDNVYDVTGERGLLLGHLQKGQRRRSLFLGRLEVFEMREYVFLHGLQVGLYLHVFKVFFPEFIYEVPDGTESNLAFESGEHFPQEFLFLAH